MELDREFAPLAGKRWTTQEPCRGVGSRVYRDCGAGWLLRLEWQLRVEVGLCFRRLTDFGVSPSGLLLYLHRYTITLTCFYSP